LGEIEVESGMQKIITTGVDNTTSFSDESSSSTSWSDE
jgi:hypothetical protein